MKTSSLATATRDRVGKAEEDGDRQHREDVEGTEAENGRDRPQGVDRAGDDGDRRDAEERGPHVPHSAQRTPALRCEPELPGLTGEQVFV